MLQHVPDVRNKKVLVMGLGLFGGGREVTRYLCEQGADVHVTDLRSREELEESLRELRDLSFSITLGEHRKKEFERADLVVVNPAVPLDSPYLEHARKHDVPLESEMNLFVKQCSAPVIGITGTAGKSTTTSMIYQILQQDDSRDVYLGGNIGRSLLRRVDQIDEHDLVVLEISSFQLEQLARIQFSPEVAVVTNISPNHLDRHGTYENYKQAKYYITQFQNADHDLILNGDDNVVSSWNKNASSNVWTFSREGVGDRGGWAEENCMYMKEDPDQDAVEVMQLDDIPLPGTFNVENALAAATAGTVAGASREQIEAGIRRFDRLSHHLIPIDFGNGITFFNDSVSTSPESTVCALEAVPGTKFVLVGGYDKGSPLEEMGRAIVEKSKGAVLFGETAPRIEEVIKAVDDSFSFERVENLDQAVKTVIDFVEPDSNVVFSPGCASYDQFQNFRHRGETFKELVRKERSRN